MKLLLHICCGPCAIYPVDQLRRDGHQLHGYFYRNNIHPFQEAQRRQKTLAAYAERIDLPVIYQSGYDIETFLQNIAFRESHRCHYCYHERLKTTAMIAKRGNFEGFSSTLLYSRYQRHDRITEIGKAIAEEVGLTFFYQDFREGWQTGIQRSKELEMYRQPYCGCIFSEKERYFRKGRD